MGKIFEDVASKIKVIAKVIFWAGVALSAIYVLFVFVASYDPITKIVGLLFAIISCLLAYVCSILMLGFGELIESLEMTFYQVGKLDREVEKTNTKLDAIDEQIAQIKESAKSEEKRG